MPSLSPTSPTSPTPPSHIRFWRPTTPSITGMLRVDHESRANTTYSDNFTVVVIYAGAFDGWYRGAVRTHAAGGIKLKEPGEVHRDLRVHAPFTLQGAAFSPDLIAEAAASLGIRGPVHFKAQGFSVGERATRLAFALHAALVRPDATEIERSTLAIETLTETLSATPPSRATHTAHRAPLAVRRARAFLHDALADKITLDALAEHAGLDKFHLVRAFRAEVGLPPYEYLTHVRVSRAKTLLQRGVLVAEAAQAVGFYDESQLHRHFRRIVGITPGRFSKSFSPSSRTRQDRPSGARAIALRSPHERTHPH